MSGLYIRLEHEILGFDPYVSGKELSRLEPELLEPLMKFFSADPEEVAGFAEGEELEIDVPEQQWFSANRRDCNT